MEAITEFMVYLADKFPAVSLILTALSVLVIVASVVVKAFPAVDKGGKIAKLVKLLDFLSVFYPKWKPAAEPTEDTAEAMALYPKTE